MFRNPKTIMLLLASGSTALAFGCDGGYWNWIHMGTIHVFQLIQTASALNLI